MQQESIISLDDVWKRYEMGKFVGLTVLKEVKLDIKKGEFIAITGPSGSGKSTMMHLLGTLDLPSWGDVLLKGESITKLNGTEIATLRGQTIGFIFQQFNLLPTFTALENVMMPMEFNHISEKDAKKRAEHLLTMIGLGDRMTHKPTELSGGQQQRVAIARALANDPEIILADEPTGNLDSKTGLFVMDFLSELNKKGKTIIIVTHEMSLLSYASRVIYMKDGRIEKEVLNGKSRRQEK
jgi:putative ABC transport system ATP-binding protein